MLKTGWLWLILKPLLFARLKSVESLLTILSPADFLYDNLSIEKNVINAAYLQKVSKLLFLGSSCIYPKHAKQPINEDALLSSELEPTESYAIAKIAGIKLCQAYRKQHGCGFYLSYAILTAGPHDTLS